MITVLFGSPGSGKTTIACRSLVKKAKSYNATFANFDCKCCTGQDGISLDGLGCWTFPEYSYIAIDEAGIEYNNRKFKSLPQETIKWFKLHRHYKCDVDIYSQSWDDMDITIRRLADRLFYIRKLGPFTLVRRVYKTVMVDKQSHQIIDGYKMVNLLWLLLKPLYYVSYVLLGLGFVLKFLCPFDEVKLVFRPLYYKYFDTHEAPPLPVPFSIQPTGTCETSRFGLFCTKLKFALTGGKDPHGRCEERALLSFLKRRRPNR